MIIRKNEVEKDLLDNCHDGTGTLICYNMLKNIESKDFPFFHYDIIPPKSSIGEHKHSNNEEIYYLLEGECILIYDGEENRISSGDFSIVTRGHSHGIINIGDNDAKLIVVASK